MIRHWMPLYVQDFLSDTFDLRTDEIGAYLLMLMIAWRRPDGALPNDQEWLKRALGSCVSDMHGNRYNRIVPPLLVRFFVLGEDGLLRNKRLTSEREKARKFSEKQKENVGKRWSRTNDSNDLTDTSVIPARALQLQSHTQRKKEEESTANAVLPLKYAFEDGIIRLNQRDFDRWQKAYNHIDLSAELLALSKWAEEQSGNWFHAVKGALAKKNREARARKEVLKDQGNFVLSDKPSLQAGYGDTWW